MRKLAWLLLLVFAFAIPWEYSLDLGEPFGNVARVAGILALLATISAILQAGRVRSPGAFQWLTLALFLWFCCSCFWTIDSTATLIKIRAWFQEMMIVWLIWELAETPSDLRNLLLTSVCGSWTLAILTLAAFRSPEALAAGQIRFAANGQDPNDLARFLDLAFPLAALLFETDHRKAVRILALGFLPVGLVAVLLTASREGFLAALVALTGSAVILARHHVRRVVSALFALPFFTLFLWIVVPTGTLDRLATIPEQLLGGDLNQRLNIWSAGWRAFARAPLIGSGAGTFVTAAHLAPIDTAHNTALSLLVSGGLCALTLALTFFVLAARSALQMRGPLRTAFVTALVAWVLTSLVATVEENRTTWLLLGMIIFAGRLAREDRCWLIDSFDTSQPSRPASQPTAPLAVQVNS